MDLSVIMKTCDYLLLCSTLGKYQVVKIYMCSFSLVQDRYSFYKSEPKNHGISLKNMKFKESNTFWFSFTFCFF